MVSNGLVRWEAATSLEVHALDQIFRYQLCCLVHERIAILRTDFMNCALAFVNCLLISFRI